MSEDNNKISIKVFHWFEKMKNNYDDNVQGMLKRFEQYNESQQSRIDKAHAEHISHLKEAHENQIAQQNKQIAQFQDDINYYKQQIAEQQQSIAQLNNRYDSVVSCLIEDKRQKSDMKDIFSEEDFVTTDDNELLESTHNKPHDTFHTEPEENIEAAPVEKQNIIAEDYQAVEQENIHQDSLKATQHQEANPETETKTEKEVDVEIDVEQNNVTEAVEENGDDLFEQAIACRQNDDNEQAFLLFKQAAQQHHIKAMGAMGRSFFLGEGVEENQPMGLAWLINAANKEHPQAIERVRYFQENNPELYSEAQTLSDQLI